MDQRGEGGESSKVKRTKKEEISGASIGARRLEGQIQRFWKSHKFEICEAVCRNNFGALFDDALMLLKKQTSLGRENLAPTLGAGLRGIIDGGSGIGVSEMTQLHRNQDCINLWRRDFVGNCLEHKERYGRDLAIDFSSSQLSRDEIFRVDRAFYRYSVLVLAYEGGAELDTCPYGNFEGLESELEEIFQVCKFTRNEKGSGALLAEGVAAFLKTIGAEMGISLVWYDR
ncbi:unnamed protein product [Tuber aestivum]|uniref:Uncharacterized protein n=1 Tax=Tuber aestivum TaxID=59557 RepID=A0A292PSR8_9PEZI|nr:unnamed protein product [Tuber aestivum]